jgi:hypothetical protein
VVLLGSQDEMTLCIDLFVESGCPLIYIVAALLIRHSLLSQQFDDVVRDLEGVDIKEVLLNKKEAA